MKRNSTMIRSLALTGGAVALTASLLGCSALEDIGRATADAWEVTYEVSVDGAEPVALTDISYLDTPTRVDGQGTVKLDQVETEARDGASAWSVDSMVMVDDLTRVSATPPADARATCRILLEGTREIASETGEAGQPVRCEARAPEFDKR